MWSLLKRDLQEFVTTVAGDTKEILANVLQKVDQDSEGEEAQQEETEERATMTTDPAILALQTDVATYTEFGGVHLPTPLRGHDEDDEEELSWGDDDTPEAHAPEVEAHAALDRDTINAAASAAPATSRPAWSEGTCGAEEGAVIERKGQQPVATEKPSPAQHREANATNTEGTEVKETGARAPSPLRHDTAPPVSAASVETSHRTEEQVRALHAEQQRRAIGVAEEREGLREQVTTLQQQLKAARQHAETLDRDLRRQTAAVISLTTENHRLKAKLKALEESIAEGAKPVGNEMPASAQEGTTHASQHGEDARPRVAEETVAALPPEYTPMSVESKEPSSGGSTGVVVVGDDEGEDEDAWESWT